MTEKQINDLQTLIDSLGSEPVNFAEQVFPSLTPYLGVYPANDSNRVMATQALEMSEYFILRALAYTPDLATWKALLDRISASGALPAGYSTGNSSVLNSEIGNPIVIAMQKFLSSTGVSPYAYFAALVSAPEQTATSPIPSAVSIAPSSAVSTTSSGNINTLESEINNLGSGPIELAGKVFPSLKPYLGVYPANSANAIHAVQALEAAEYALLLDSGIVPDLNNWKALLDSISAGGTLPADYSSNGSPVLNSAIGAPIFAAISAYRKHGGLVQLPVPIQSGSGADASVLPAAPVVSGVPNWIVYAVAAFVAAKVFKIL